jgi:hypothetical protein
VRRFVSNILPFVFLIHSLVFFYFYTQPIYSFETGTEEIILGVTTVLFTSPLYFLTALLELIPMFTVPVLVWQIFIYSLFGIPTLLVFIGLLRKSKIALYILMFSAVLHTVIGLTPMIGIISFSVFIIPVLVVVTLINLGILYSIRENYS